MNKEIRTTFLNKRAKASYWNEHDITPDSGELIVYLPDDPSSDVVQIKVGDGTTLLSQLNFIGINEVECDDDGVVEAALSLTSSGGLSLSASHKTYNEGITEAGPTQSYNVAAGNTSEISVPHVSVDKYGHVSAEEQTLTITIPSELPSPQCLKIGNKTYDGAEEVEIQAKDLGISSVLKFAGVTITHLTDKSYQSPIDIKNGEQTIKCVPEMGDVVVDLENMEYLWDGMCWQQLGDANSFKRKQSPVEVVPNVPNTFVDSITQDENGMITATTKPVSMPNYASSTSIGGPAQSAESLAHDVTIFLHGGSNLMPSSCTTDFRYDAVTITIPQIVESNIVYESEDEHGATEYLSIDKKYLEKSAEISTDKLSSGTKILILDCGDSTTNV